MKFHRGFTFIELIVVISIVGILAVFAYAKFQKAVANNQLQRAALNLTMELREIRPLALKTDTVVKVKFTASPSQLSVFVDKNGNNTIETGELLRTYTIASPAIIGIAPTATGGPTTGPNYGMANAIAYDASGIAGGWKDSVMRVDNNSLGSISGGAIYLYTTRLKVTTYCVGISSATQTLRLYKWDGGTLWKPL
jgi:prepilin-type N-terminal cleavage/methylation domain-containing protein